MEELTTFPTDKHLRDYQRDRRLGIRREVHPDCRRYGKHATQRGVKGKGGLGHGGKRNANNPYVKRC